MLKHGVACLIGFQFHVHIRNPDDERRIKNRIYVHEIQLRFSFCF